jgi:hypothetical protein
MTTYEQCKKVGFVINPFLRKQPQEGQGMWGCGGKDRMMNTRKAPNGCGEQDERGLTNLKRVKGLVEVK